MHVVHSGHGRALPEPSAKAVDTRRGATHQHFDPTIGEIDGMAFEAEADGLVPRVGTEEDSLNTPRNNAAPANIHGNARTTRYPASTPLPAATRTAVSSQRQLSACHDGCSAQVVLTGKNHPGRVLDIWPRGHDSDASAARRTGSYRPRENGPEDLKSFDAHDVIPGGSVCLSFVPYWPRRRRSRAMRVEDCCYYFRLKGPPCGCCFS